jgi:DNA-directed RNA polymerase specialized sigma24 family protein
MASKRPVADARSQTFDQLTVEGMFRHYASQICDALVLCDWQPADVQDAISEVFQALLRAPDRIATIRDAPGFLFKSAKNQLINRTRRRKRTVLLLAQMNPDGLRFHPGVGVYFKKKIDSVLARLPENRQEVLLCLLVDGTKPGSLAREFGVTTRTILRWKKEFMSELGRDVCL